MNLLGVQIDGLVKPWFGSVGLFAVNQAVLFICPHKLPVTLADQEGNFTIGVGLVIEKVIAVVIPYERDYLKRCICLLGN